MLANNVFQFGRNLISGLIPGNALEFVADPL
jgi:hypothetical protein